MVWFHSCWPTFCWIWWPSNGQFDHMTPNLRSSASSDY
jgi:hypothetical protein